MANAAANCTIRRNLLVGAYTASDHNGMGVAFSDSDMHLGERGKTGDCPCRRALRRRSSHPEDRIYLEGKGNRTEMNAHYLVPSPLDRQAQRRAVLAPNREECGLVATTLALAAPEHENKVRCQAQNHLSSTPVVQVYYRSHPVETGSRSVVEWKNCIGRRPVVISEVSSATGPRPPRLSKPILIMEPRWSSRIHGKNLPTDKSRPIYVHVNHCRNMRLLLDASPVTKGRPHLERCVIVSLRK